MNFSSSAPTVTEKKKPSAFAKGSVFFDFDNTITTLDVLDDLLERFSINDQWRVLEEKWQTGAMGTKECLEGQLRSVRITPEALEKYVRTISIDPSFPRLLKFLQSRRVPVVIVSDNFSLIVKKILKNYGISGVRVYSNGIRFRGDRLVPSFPYQDPACPRCAHCKRRHLLEVKDKTRIYVGDGLSDVCPAEEADRVFAKASLAEYLKKKGKSFIPFENLKEVYQRLLEWKENGEL